MEGWPTETTQAGDRIRDVLTQLGSRVEWSRGGLTVVGSPSVLPGELDLADASELTPSLAALFGVNQGPFTIRGVAHIRGHETDRISALVTELRKIGADVDEFEDGFRVNKGGHAPGTWGDLRRPPHGPCRGGGRAGDPRARPGRRGVRVEDLARFRRGVGAGRPRRLGKGVEA